MNIPELTSIIYSWEHYEKESVFMAIGELKKRGYNFPQNIEKKINQFCIKNNISNIDEALNLFFQDKGENFIYEHYNKKIVGVLEETVDDKEIYTIKHPKNISSAGESLKTVVYCYIAIIANFILGFYLISNSKDTETLKGIYIFIGTISLVFNILMLVSLYNAGDNLVKACKKIVSE